ncbi:CoA ester lyase [Mycolicibacterium sp.]|uniref:HpcH/HpaI aldolase/citrate lyase family protein n=1 Tax=Mycolicibacterium sp. TaxID=2320850 RepID=UPI0025EF5180|nr:CoA ester lyase [Mycolicibacterium sp.]
MFVPGDRPERFAKAAGCGADGIVLDLEDAVEPARKPSARRNVADWLARGGVGMVRINGAETPWYTDDLAMIAEYGCPVMVPKAEPEMLRAARLAAPVIALIETAAGVLVAAEICAVETVVRAAFGSVDLAAELGVDPEAHEALRYARSAVVLGAAAAGQQAPLDGVTTDLQDENILKADVAQAVRLGFGGKLCIHPRQVAHVNEQFAPSAEEMDWAQRVVAVAADGGARVVGGKMVDKPVVDRARRILARGNR